MKLLTKLKPALGVTTGILGLGFLLVLWIYPEISSAVYTTGLLFIACLGILLWQNQKGLRKAVKGRTFKYGANAAITVGLVLAILIVLNYLNANHFYKKDFTKNKTYSLSDQTTKILKDLKDEVALTAFVKAQARDQIKALFENYAYISKKIKFEFVDPDRDPSRTKAAGVREYGTVIVTSGKKETRISEPNEEKLTNALIKVLKKKITTVCSLSGHGEKSFDATDAEGFSSIKQELSGQSYESRTVNSLNETKVPEDCDVVLILGPTKAFFEKEVSVIEEWLDNGGRVLIALDPNLKSGADYSPEMKGLVEKWGVEIGHNLVLDPTSRLLGVNASVPVVGEYNVDHPVTKDFKNTALFPLTSTVKIKSGLPSSLKTWWLAKSTPRSVIKSDFKEIAKGQVKIDEKKDVIGSQELLVAVEGSRDANKKGPKPTRLVVFGTSNFAINGYARHGANSDLFLNLISWLGDDENLISIRAKEEDNQMPTLGQAEGRFIQLLTMILIPGGVLLLGLFVWIRRRRL
ncbi:MAG: GldG family protein [Bacteriovoracia bacterium]